MTYNDYYESPEMTASLISVENVICTSPQPGGNEGIGYEDWNF